MTDKAKLDERVLEWIASEGYPLEYETAAEFRKKAFHVRQGFHYDTKDAAPREVDVLAQLTTLAHDTLLRISHVVECKWSGENPWVVFTSPHSRIRPSACVAQTIADEVGEFVLDCLAGDDGFASSHLFASPARPGFGARPAFQKGKDQAYSAMQGAVAACYALARKEKSSSILRTLEQAEIFFPLIVIDGALFEAFYDDEGQELKVRAAESVRMHWRGAADWRLHATIDIVTAAGLPAFLEQRARACRAAIPRLASVIAQVRACIEEGTLEKLEVLKAPLGKRKRFEFMRVLKAHIASKT